MECGPILPGPWESGKFPFDQKVDRNEQNTFAKQSKYALNFAFRLGSASRLAAAEMMGRSFWTTSFI